MNLEYQEIAGAGPQSTPSRSLYRTEDTDFRYKTQALVVTPSLNLIINLLFYINTSAVKKVCLLYD